MGTQQLLLITLAVVVVSVLIAIGIVMFRDQAASQNLDSLSNDLVYLASQARKYYHRPSIMRGGNGSFGRMMMSELMSRPTNQNGTYSLIPDPVPAGEQSCIFIGIGKEIGSVNTDFVKVTMQVWPDSMVLVVDN